MVKLLTRASAFPDFDLLSPFFGACPERRCGLFVVTEGRPFERW